jgi:hypothetical protein
MDKMFNFGEKQGRLEIKLTLYLNQDLDNEELEKLFNEVEIKVEHYLVSDIDIEPIEE